MLELNQILRANEINFAVLAALPALLFAIAVGWLLRRPFIKGKGAEGRGRQAQLERRMLMADAEKAVMICQISIEEGQVSKTYMCC
jgi:nuclear-control-of-ATPase protein 2